MSGMLSNSLIMPAAVLAGLAFAVPRVLALLLPEGVKPLMLNALLSTVILFMLSTAFFVLLYIWQGVPISEIRQSGIAANIGFFGQRGLIAAIIWAPIMVLSVAALPRNWVEETW